MQSWIAFMQWHLLSILFVLSGGLAQCQLFAPLFEALFPLLGRQHFGPLKVSTPRQGGRGGGSIVARPCFSAGGPVRDRCRPQCRDIRNVSHGIFKRFAQRKVVTRYREKNPSPQRVHTCLFSCVFHISRLPVHVVEMAQAPTNIMSFGPAGPQDPMRRGTKREIQLTQPLGGRAAKMTRLEPPMGSASQFPGAAGAPLDAKVPVSTAGRDFSMLDKAAQDGAGLFPLPPLDRFSALSQAGMEMTIHDDGATQSGNSQSDHVVTDSVILAQSFYAYDYYKLEAMQRRLPQGLPIMALTPVSRAEEGGSLDPRQYMETVAQVNYNLYKKAQKGWELKDFALLKRKLRFAGAVLHMLHNPDISGFGHGNLLTYLTLVIDGKIDLANLWMTADGGPAIDGSRLFLLGTRCTEGHEDEEFKCRRMHKPCMIRGDEKSTYWRFDPYVLNRPGVPDMQLWNGPDWEGLCIYVGRVMECGGSQGETSRYRHMIQSVLHPRGDTFNNDLYHKNLERLPRITVSLGFGGGF